MTMYKGSVRGLPLGRRWARPAFVLAAVLWAAGCDIEWGGASFHLEDPAPLPPEAAVDEATEVAVVPLPPGPLLWLVRSTGAAGEALAMPVAAIEGGAPVALEFPTPVPDGYRARFDSTFAPGGRELALGAGGVRTGSLLLTGPPRVVDAGCPSAFPARMLVPPGATAPSVAFAVGPELVTAEIGVVPEVLLDNRIRTFGPILAEQLLRQGGEDQPFLAQRASLVALPWPGDERPAMAATYLINDALDLVPPQGESVSLFFLARFDPALGYVTDWSEFRTYRGDTREAFVWLEAAPGPAGRIDFAVLLDGAVRRLVASVAREGEARGIDWTEGSRCPSLELLEVPGG